MTPYKQDIRHSGEGNDLASTKFTIVGMAITIKRGPIKKQNTESFLYSTIPLTKALTAGTKGVGEHFQRITQVTYLSKQRLAKMEAQQHLEKR